MLKARSLLVFCLILFSPPMQAQDFYTSDEFKPLIEAANQSLDLSRQDQQEIAQRLFQFENEKAVSAIEPTILGKNFGWVEQELGAHLLYGDHLGITIGLDKLPFIPGKKLAFSFYMDLASGKRVKIPNILYAEELNSQIKVGANYKLIYLAPGVTLGNLNGQQFGGQVGDSGNGTISGGAEIPAALVGSLIGDIYAGEAIFREVNRTFLNGMKSLGITFAEQYNVQQIEAGDSAQNDITEEMTLGQKIKTKSESLIMSADDMRQTVQVHGQELYSVLKDDILPEVGPLIGDLMDTFAETAADNAFMMLTINVGPTAPRTTLAPKLRFNVKRVLPEIVSFEGNKFKTKIFRKSDSEVFAVVYDADDGEEITRDTLEKKRRGNCYERKGYTGPGAKSIDFCIDEKESECEVKVEKLVGKEKTTSSCNL